jgi:hypothetical protein
MKKQLLLLMGSSLLAVGATLAASPAQAANLVSGFVAGNDCSGLFGTGFENCEVNDSPVIAKFKGNPTEGLEDVNNGDYPTIDGDEWTFTGNGDFKTGSWQYNPDDGNDPGIRYWAAKAGNGFNFFYMIDGDAATCSAANVLTVACLNQAQTVTSGEWFTPGGKGLSHLTFYNTGDHGGGGSQDIPEPAAMAGLMAVGAGIVLNRRKKVRQA